jgi:RND family efflux transporter MFP subunit
VTEWDEFNGRIEAVESVEIRARVTGYISEIHFKAGDVVERGALLFLIDPLLYQADLDRAAANLDQAEVQQKLAELELRRAEKLRGTGALSAEEYDQKAAELQRSHASVRAATAARDTAALNLGYTQIKSPIAGRVSDARMTVGNLVSTSSTGAEGVLTTVVSIDPIYVHIDADENAVLRFMKQHAEGARKSAREAKLPAFIQLANEENFPHEGHLDFVDNRLDPATGTLRARGVFKTWDQLLVPGFFVRMRIPSGPKAPRVLIPDQVVSSQQGVKFVYVVKPDNTLERRNLETGEMAEGLRIVRSGLKAGEQVVSTRLQMLRPGMSVQLVAEQPTAAPAPEPGTEASK